MIVFEECTASIIAVSLPGPLPHSPLAPKALSSSWASSPLPLAPKAVSSSW